MGSVGDSLTSFGSLNIFFALLEAPRKPHPIKLMQFLPLASHIVVESSAKMVSHFGAHLVEAGRCEGVGDKKSASRVRCTKQANIPSDNNFIPIHFQYGQTKALHL